MNFLNCIYTAPSDEQYNLPNDSASLRFVFNMTTTDQYHSKHVSLDIPEDHMEMVTSPYRHPDDLDIDIDIENEQLTNYDNMNEVDAVDFDVMQGEELEDYEDDEMADEEQLHYENTGEEQELLDWQDDELSGYAEGQEPIPSESAINITENSNPSDEPNIGADRVSQTDQAKDEQEDMFDEDNRAHIATSDPHIGASNYSDAVANPHPAHEGVNVTAQLHTPDIENTMNKNTGSGLPDINRQALDTAPDRVLVPAPKTSTQIADYGEGLTSTAPNSETPGNDEREDSVLDPNVEEGVDGETETEPAKAESKLHPVQLVWGDEQYNLFSSGDTENDTHFLLEDTTCATKSFDVLLSECRRVLGAEVPDYHDLVIDFSTLGLHICEDSKYASQISLSQVVDAYMLLSQNEQCSDIGPLACTLTTRPCTLKQIHWLQEQADGGRSYSEVIAEILVDQFDGSDIEGDSQALNRPGDGGEAYEHNNTVGEHEEHDYQQDDQEPTSIATNIQAEGEAHSRHDVGDPHDEVEDLFSNTDDDERQEVTKITTHISDVEGRPHDSVGEPTRDVELGTSTDREVVPATVDVLGAKDVYVSTRLPPEVARKPSADGHKLDGTSPTNDKPTTNDVISEELEDDDDLLDLDIDDQPESTDVAADGASRPLDVLETSSAKRKLELDQEDFEVDISITPVKKNRSL